ncbi:DUF4260 domain-containing protein [Roseivirga pacifica]|uniref:DUF4260 domain-containing protein n=1 Tax=Roseivirga pacifica TaxID=1267423 RepID=UPI002095CFF3|nr:DUF4260 domain-containing protein [Roseivirga pacifica]MCO6360789.1 DUF4260 family protein [Roseivirga pacifica]MCO6368678.1 DUF4260 family protein [Roseivirga pacifica]MCO6372821.1 DUF4260 family protein [Roseivirga pacifica]MCO6376880.1 DUF4260 family protein [Roseivirga pacifica]MCO6377842.1 DUF4260 family protein [Roseivirga pacifica]
MKTSLKLEELAMFGLSIYLFNQTDFAWWWYLALILTPDIGMIGYAISTKVGAFTYNLFHHKAVVIAVLCLGWYMGNSALELAGIILFGHASMDRMFGYGLKYPDHFKHTHLGWMDETS